MPLDDSVYYNALAARDSRFDGVFFVGVTSTGIYCRPICPAKTPKKANCRFFASAEAAERDSFRPCLRCRPELAPGSAPVDDAHRIVHLLAQRIEEGLIDGDAGLEDIAAQFELSARQIRRIVKKQLGVSPVELLRTRRLLLAKQLLTETTLPVTEIAFASGFSSLRRFNHVFSTRYTMPPSRFRKQVAEAERPPAVSDTSTIQLAYRPPYDWDGILSFLRARALAGVERVTEDGYFRTVRLGAHTGWAGVRYAPEKTVLLLEFTHSLTPVLPALIGRIRNLFDLGARPDIIAERLMQDNVLKAAVTKNPGLRVPGAFDGFEMAVRAILGQQVTVRAATTLGGRFADAFGEAIETPVPGLTHLSPAAERIAEARVDDIAALGIVGARAKSLIALADAFAAGGLRLDAGASPDTAIERLVTIPGIGRWTAHYIAMRALRWPDAFPKEDIAVRNRLGGVTANQAEEMSQAWRPWRSYAVLHLWQMPPNNATPTP
jgi:AraC family transcriptional regulator of adaptative response / DNA-3-methyladenine glycosylase II